MWRFFVSMVVLSVAAWSSHAQTISISERRSTCTRADLILLLDQSSSISVESNTFLWNAVEAFVSSFYLEPDGVRIALSSFSNNILEETPFLSNDRDATEILGSLDKEPYGGTDLHLALVQAEGYINTSTRERPDIPHRIVILLSDGDPIDPRVETFNTDAEALDYYSSFPEHIVQEVKRTKALAQKLRDELGATIFAINVSPNESSPWRLKNIASAPSEIHYLETSYKDLIDLLERLDPCG